MKKGFASWKFANGSVEVFEHHDNDFRLQKGFALLKQVNGKIRYQNESDPENEWSYFDKLLKRDPQEFETLVKDVHMHHLMTRLQLTLLKAEETGNNEECVVSNNCCSICTENLGERQKAVSIVRTKCNHLFCEPCLNEWLLRSLSGDELE